MKIRQLHFPTLAITAEALAPLREIEPQLVLAFASVAHFEQGVFSAELRASLPGSQWLGCSTAGEIAGACVHDDSAVLTAIRFDHPDFRLASAPLGGMEESEAVGASLGRALQAPDLHGVLLLGQGVNINGSALIAGLASEVGPSVRISGGLAGDGGRFQGCHVLGGPGSRSEHAVTALGIYGPHLRLGHGREGGWQAFGPLRQITRFSGNVLHELDGRPALELYRKYLGEHARDLPASGLLFPFAMSGPDGEELGLIRTILGIDNDSGSLILAGDLIAGGHLRLMHASCDMLVDGAEAAARRCREALPGGEGLALLVSCVGRKLVMGGRVDEEVEAVGAVLGAGYTLAGFYSNGEISPEPQGGSRLHNQTMTITCLSER